MMLKLLLKELYKDINKHCGKTVLIHGENIRNIYNFRQHEKKINSNL